MVIFAQVCVKTFANHVSPDRLIHLNAKARRFYVEKKSVIVRCG